MIKLFSKSENAEIFLNENKILYVVPSTDVGSIIRMENNTVIPVTNDISYFNKLFFPVEDKPKMASSMMIPQNNPITPKPITKDTVYENLPKTPNGNIDKRTNEYKAYMESNSI